MGKQIEMENKWFTKRQLNTKHWKVKGVASPRKDANIVTSFKQSRFRLVIKYYWIYDFVPC